VPVLRLALVVAFAHGTNTTANRRKDKEIVATPVTFNITVSPSYKRANMAASCHGLTGNWGRAEARPGLGRSYCCSIAVLARAAGPIAAVIRPPLCVRAQLR
jgi:hypothetical protein